jgi:phage FluMu protein Com
MPRNWVKQRCIGLDCMRQKKSGKVVGEPRIIFEASTDAAGLIKLRCPRCGNWNEVML